MTKTKPIHINFLVAILILFLSLQSSVTTAAVGSSPLIVFSNSCRAEVQADFSEAVALLHSFEYAQSSKIFENIIQRDPDCAMAQWGVAMNLWHPLWAPPNSENLEKGAKLLANTDDLDKTPRESAYIDALKTFYSSADTSTNSAREQAYETRMAKLYMQYLDDPEAAIFYALSILSTADPRDKTYSHQYKAAGVLNWVRSAHPNHPGVLHYTIHAYDFPGIAHLALPSAMVYADAAPNSAHAQHMPSHIFTRLGLWDRSLSSNHHSDETAIEYTENAKLPGYYDQGIHAMDYLMYGMLQTGRIQEASALLDRINGIKKAHNEMLAVAFTYAAAPARYTLELRKWDQASQLELGHPEFPWEKFKWAPSVHFFARGFGAVRSGKIAQAHQEIAKLENLQSSLPSTTLLYMRDQVQVQINLIKSWVLLSEGKVDAALLLAKTTAEREDSVDKHPVTPGAVLPARELYADMLQETGNSTEALKQYQIVLQSSPNRLNALKGAQQAAERIADQRTADIYKQTICKQTSRGQC